MRKVVMVSMLFACDGLRTLPTSTLRMVLSESSPAIDVPRTRLAGNEAADAIILSKMKRGNTEEDHVQALTPATHVAALPGVPSVRGKMPQGRRPDWFRVPAPGGEHTRYKELKDTLEGSAAAGTRRIATVCEEAHCPNIGDCWNGDAQGKGATATIMLLGDTCTRGCKFCAVKTSATPEPPDETEPWHTAEAVASWGIDYVVLTSVDRDDLPDGGARHFAETVQLLKIRKPQLKVECLVSDFAGDEECVRTLAQSGLDVFAHNVETVRRLQRHVRDKRANYEQARLAVLA